MFVGTSKSSRGHEIKWFRTLQSYIYAKLPEAHQTTNFVPRGASRSPADHFREIITVINIGPVSGSVVSLSLWEGSGFFVSNCTLVQIIKICFIHFVRLIVALVRENYFFQNKYFFQNFRISRMSDVHNTVNCFQVLMIKFYLTKKYKTNKILI